jgi:filamentous hemagglutinin
MLRASARGKGNFGIGTATRQDTDVLGHAWVDPGYTVASDGKTLVSTDRLRQYRPPSFKPNLGRIQANLEYRLQPAGHWQSNAHIDVVL